MRKSVDFGLTRRFSKECLIFLAVVSTTWLVTSVSAFPSSAVLNNGLVELGVNPQGDLIVSPGIGLTYIPTGGEALAPGCWCEGWGVADSISGVSGKADQAQAVVNMTVQSFTVTATTAVSVVTVSNIFQVTHDFHPSVSPNLFEATVTIKNISGATVDVLYRRVMDWDIPPTEFHEFVTIGGLPATAVIYSDDNGFSDADPLLVTAPIDPATVNVNFVHDGPLDHGAHFDFDFGALAPGGTVQFKIYYGAAGSETEAMAVLAQINAEVYSLGEPSNIIPPTGEPNTFIFAFTGVGGTPIGGNTVCIQDNNTDDYIRFDPNTGEYTVTQCSSESTFTGTGRVQQVRCITILRDTSNGRSLFAIAQAGMCGNRGLFGMIDHNSRTKIYGFDSNLTNNSCSCGQVE
jgi:hypothetical protein